MNKPRSLLATLINSLAVKDPRNVSKLMEQSPELFEYDDDVKKIEGVDKISAGGVALFALAYMLFVRINEREMVDKEKNDECKI